MRSLCVAVFLYIAFPLTAAAQFFVYSPVSRPTNVSYQVLQSKHFEIIFESGYLGEAEAALRVLNKHVHTTRELLAHHGSLHMPIVLNGFNDQSNGYVTPLPFKQEIEIPYLKGRSLSPVHPSWMDTVLPHELVHAVHANVQRGFGFGAVLRPFAPDIVRAFNLFIPQGISEGIAVHYESRHQPGAGRLNHGFFTMRFRAAMATDKPWSMAQLVEMPAHTRPFDRFYLGGAHLVDYLAAQDSLKFFERSSDLNYRIPFLGYGLGLWYGAKKWPGKVYREFLQHTREQEAARIASLGNLSTPEVLAAKRGTAYRRPQWMDSSRLVVYAQGYNKRSGFYVHDVTTGRQRQLRATVPTSDFVYNLTPDKTTLLYAHNTVDPFIAIKRVVDLYEIELETGRQTRLTTNKRLGAPAPEANGDILALQTKGQTNTLVRLSATGAIDTLATDSRVRFKEITPGAVWTAAVINVNGRQGLFKLDAAGEELVVSPLVRFKAGSVYDVSWSADGRFLFFSADPGGISNVFVLEVASGEVRQVTNALYGALEPALSPDGESLAYINYAHEQFELVLLPFTWRDATPVQHLLYTSRVAPAGLFAEVPQVKLPVVRSVSRYRALRYMKPRMLLPVLRPETSVAVGRVVDTGVGLRLQGTDPLERLRYNLLGYYQSGRAWGSATLQGSAGALQPFVKAYHTLSTVSVAFAGIDGNTFVGKSGRQRRGASVGAQLPMVFERNVFQSGLTLGTEVGIEGTRFFAEEAPPFEQRVFIEPRATAFYKVQANTRDIIPNQGLLLSAQSLVDLQRDGGNASRAFLGRLTGYLPLLQRANVGLQGHVALLTQNTGSVYNLDRFLPRGYLDRVAPGKGNHVVAGFEYVQPLWFVDNGLFMLPIYIKALYAFGFTEGLLNSKALFIDADDQITEGERRALVSSGVGIGARFRLFYLFNFDVRFTAAFRHADRAWDFDVR